MAFLLQDLGKVSSGANTNAPTVWSYSTVDSAGDIEAVLYFDSKGGQGGFSVGDLLYVNTDTGTTAVPGLYTVLTSTTGTVTIAAFAQV